MSDDYERFCECDELKEQYNKGRADAIDDFEELLIQRWWAKLGDFECIVEDKIKEIAEQIREQNNE